MNTAAVDVGKFSGTVAVEIYNSFHDEFVLSSSEFEVVGYAFLYVDVVVKRKFPDAFDPAVGGQGVIRVVVEGERVMSRAEFDFEKFNTVS